MHMDLLNNNTVAENDLTSNSSMNTSSCTSNKESTLLGRNFNFHCSSDACHFTCKHCGYMLACPAQSPDANSKCSFCFQFNDKALTFNCRDVFKHLNMYHNDICITTPNNVIEMNRGVVELEPKDSEYRSHGKDGNSGVGDKERVGGSNGNALELTSECHGTQNCENRYGSKMSNAENNIERQSDGTPLSNSRPLLHVSRAQLDAYWNNWRESWPHPDFPIDYPMKKYRPIHPWTALEDAKVMEQFCKLSQLPGKFKWHQVAEAVPDANKNADATMKRWHGVIEPRWKEYWKIKHQNAVVPFERSIQDIQCVVKTIPYEDISHWTPEEDRKLLLKRVELGGVEGADWGKGWYVQDMMPLVPNRTRLEVVGRCAKLFIGSGYKLILADVDKKVSCIDYSDEKETHPYLSCHAVYGDVDERAVVELREPLDNGTPNYPVDYTENCTDNSDSNTKRWKLSEDRRLLEKLCVLNNDVWCLNDLTSVLPGRTKHEIAVRWKQLLLNYKFKLRFEDIRTVIKLAEINCKVEQREDAPEIFADDRSVDKTSDISLMNDSPDVSTRSRRDLTISSSAPWAASEDALLLTTYYHLDDKWKWSDVSAALAGRTDRDCHKRWNHVLKNKVKEYWKANNPLSSKAYELRLEDIKAIIAKVNYGTSSNDFGRKRVSSKCALKSLSSPGGSDVEHRTKKDGFRVISTPVRAISKPDNSGHSEHGSVDLDEGRMSVMCTKEVGVGDCKMLYQDNRNPSPFSQLQSGVGPWTPSEDKTLMYTYYHLDDKWKWSDVSAALAGRTDRDCHKRWNKVLYPKIKKHWYQVMGNCNYELKLDHLDDIVKTVEYSDTELNTNRRVLDRWRDRFNCEFCRNVYHTRDAVLEHHSACSQNNKRTISPSSVGIPVKVDSSADLLDDEASFSDWTAEEDRLIMSRNPNHSWESVASALSKSDTSNNNRRARCRKAKECHERWHYLRSAEKSAVSGSGDALNPWSAEEDALLLRQFYALGCKWTEVAAGITGRSASTVAKRFRCVVEPKLKEFWFKMHGNKNYSLKLSDVESIVKTIDYHLECKNAPVPCEASERIPSPSTLLCANNLNVFADSVSSTCLQGAEVVVGNSPVIPDIDPRLGLGFDLLKPDADWVHLNSAADECTGGLTRVPITTKDIENNSLPSVDANINALALSTSGEILCEARPGNKRENIRWNALEEELILSICHVIGPKWQRMVEILPGKTYKSLSCRYHTNSPNGLRRKVEEMSILTYGQVVSASPTSGHILFDLEFISSVILSDAGTKPELQPRNFVPWSEEEDSKLLALYLVHDGAHKWQDITTALSQQLGVSERRMQRSIVDVAVHWVCDLKPIISRLVHQEKRCNDKGGHATVLFDAAQISNILSDFCLYKDSREANKIEYFYQHRTNPWTSLEDERLLRAYHELGPMWTGIVRLSFRRERSAMDVSKRWCCFLSAKVAQFVSRKETNDSSSSNSGRDWLRLNPYDLSDIAGIVASIDYAENHQCSNGTVSSGIADDSKFKLADGSCSTSGLDTCTRAHLSINTDSSTSHSCAHRVHPIDSFFKSNPDICAASEPELGPRTAEDKWRDVEFVQPTTKKRKVQSNYVVCRKCKSKHTLSSGVYATIDFEWYCPRCLHKIALVCDGCDEEYSLDTSGLPITFDGIVVPEGKFYCIKCSQTTHSKQAAHAAVHQVKVTSNYRRTSTATAIFNAGIDDTFASGECRGKRRKRSVFTPSVTSNLIRGIVRMKNEIAKNHSNSDLIVNSDGTMDTPPYIACPPLTCFDNV